MKKIVILLALIFFFSCEKQQEEKQLPRTEQAETQFKLGSAPRPILEKHAHLVDLYWKAWELLQAKISDGTAKNGFVDAYLDEGFNELIYQWDTCFMALFAMYGGDEIPAMASLDNFYRLQREDGWICRVYRESDGQPAEQPSMEEPMINPPLFAWVEWKYFLLTGDSSRFKTVLPVLDAYFNWIDENCRGNGAAAGLYYNTHLGSGMDNSPRSGIEQGGWVDLSSQMALFAKHMFLMARQAGADSLTTRYEKQYRLLNRIINGKLWDGRQNFYYDLSAQNQKMPVKTAAAFWPLLSETATLPQARALAVHLKDSSEFYRKHLFPSLSADHPQYKPLGQYWQGGVWAPVNYMIIKGLDMYPLRELAAEAAFNHVENIYKVYRNFTPQPGQIAPEERDDNYATIWECYAPDTLQPATRWDGKYLSRQDFVGWSGLGPVALLLENIIGLQPSAPSDELYWNLRLRERHGVENYRFGDNRVDIICEENNLPVNSARIRIDSSSSFRLVMSTQAGQREFLVPAGESEYEITL
ncbi:MAG: trehalase family glycosidase [Calditrichia bacterium]